MIEKTIIANYGDKNLGKTESIIMVYDLLKGKDESETPFLYKPEEHNGDLCARITINNIKIGISSPGDPGSYQKRWLKELIEKEKCQIIIAACRDTDDGGKTREVITSLAAKHSYRIIWTCNARIFEDVKRRGKTNSITTQFNEQWATEIANMIESWCYA